MEKSLDLAWQYIATAIAYCGHTFFAFLQHLHFLGPAVLFALLALATVALTKLLSKVIVTKRFLALKKEFHHWVKVREEALKCTDREKGRMMARNIDQATLNKAYYDYFFEGLLLGIVRKILPIFFMFAFINEFYRLERMQEIFDREFVLQMGTISGEPMLVGAVFWYFLMLVAGYLLWWLTGKFWRTLNRATLANPAAPPEHSGC